MAPTQINVELFELKPFARKLAKSKSLYQTNAELSAVHFTYVEKLFCIYMYLSQQ